MSNVERSIVSRVIELEGIADKIGDRFPEMAREGRRGRPIEVTPHCLSDRSYH